MANNTPAANNTPVIILSPLKFLTLGYSVIPSGGGDKSKAPLVDWTQYQNKPPTENDLEEWEEKYHPVLWGVVTGRVSNVVVIDVDKPGDYQIFPAQNLKPHVQTPRGGYHFYFHHPGFPIKTIAGLMPGLDIRADGGFVNVIGTNPKTGGEYKINILPIPETTYKWESLPEPIRALILKGNKGRAPRIQGIIPEGERDSTLTSLAGSMQRRGMSTEAIKAALMQVNEARCQPPLPETDVDKIIKSISRYEPTAPAPAPAVKSPKDNHDDQQAALKLLATVEPQEVYWLWYPYIPLGKLTLLEGDPGTGKSWLSLAITTAVSLGQGIEGMTEFAHGPVLIASAEDGLGDTIRPRLDKLGAVVKRIYAIDGLFTLDHDGITLLEKYIQDVMPVLVVIDPLVVFLSGEVDIHKANMVRQVTASLARLAEDYGPAILAIRHLTKGGSLKPIYRGLGSIDFTASARSVLLAGYDADNPQSRGFCHIKCNLAPVGEAVGFEIRDGQFYWTGKSELTIDQILKFEDGGNLLSDAKNFLIKYLASGEQPAKEIYEAAEANGFHKRTLDTAKAELKIEVSRQGELGKRGPGQWLWRLPGGENED